MGLAWWIAGVICFLTIIGIPWAKACFVIGHIMSALACFVTIIGIPFGIQHLKLAVIALAPIGMTIVSSEEAVVTRSARRGRGGW